MIGLSLSYCVRDILAGTVPLDQVDMLVTGTNAPDRATLDTQVIAPYQRTYWRQHPEAARTLALHLWDTGRIIQPKRDGLPGPVVGAHHWILT